jgi:hypothetical protein
MASCMVGHTIRYLPQVAAIARRYGMNVVAPVRERRTVAGGAFSMVERGRVTLCNSEQRTKQAAAREVALPLCAAARPLYTRSANILGT